MAREQRHNKYVAVLEYDVPNKNGRVYSKAAIEQTQQRLKARIEEGRPLLVSLGQNKNPWLVDLNRVSHTITDVKMSGDKMMCKMKTLQTPSGDIIKEFEKRSVDFHIAPVGTCNVDDNGVVRDLNIIYFSVNNGKR